MAPPKKLPKTEEAAKEQGLSSMTSFFSLKPKPGRPTKNSSKAGRKAAAESPDAAAVAAPTAAVAKPQAKKVAIARRNWSKGEGLKAMTDAVAEWEQEQKKQKKNVPACASLPNSTTSRTPLYKRTSPRIMRSASSLAAALEGSL